MFRELRVLHVVTSLAQAWGGPARVVSSLAQELAAFGINCRIMTTDAKGEEGMLQPPGVPVDLYPTTRIAAVWRGHSPQLYQRMKERVKSSDLVHVHEIWNFPLFAAWRAAMGNEIPYLVSVHGALEKPALRVKAVRKGVYFWLLQRRILEGAAVLHAVTNSEAESLRALGLTRSVVTIPNGVRLEDFDLLPDRRAFEQQYPIVRGRRMILFMGRLHPIKGLDLLAEAFRSLARTDRDVCLVIAGPDERGTRAGLERALTDQIRDGSVVLTGMLSGEARLAAFARADVFVLPARSEVRGLVTLEAMACRLPLVITQAVGFPEVEEAQAGLVVPFDQEALAGALRRLLDDPALRQQMGRNGRRLVEAQYTWSNVASQMAACYRSIVR